MAVLITDCPSCGGTITNGGGKSSSCTNCADCPFGLISTEKR